MELSVLKPGDRVIFILEFALHFSTNEQVSDFGNSIRRRGPSSQQQDAAKPALGKRDRTG